MLSHAGLCLDEQHPADAHPAREDVPVHGRPGAGGGHRGHAQQAAVEAQQRSGRAGKDLCSQVHTDKATLNAIVIVLNFYFFFKR